MARVNAYIVIDDVDLINQFAGDADFESTLRARLEEVYDGDGNPVPLRLLGIDVEED